MFGELPRVFSEVNEFLAPIRIEFREEINKLTKILFKAQYLYLPKLDMRKFDYNLNNLIILKDFYDYSDYPEEYVASVVMAHNLAVLFLKLNGTSDCLRSGILNSSITCEELEKDLAKKNPYAILLLYKGFKQSHEFRKMIQPEEISKLPEEINKRLSNLEIIDGPLIDFNNNFRKYIESKIQAGISLKEEELKTRKLLDRYFLDENTPKSGFQLNPYTEESGIILE